MYNYTPFCRTRITLYRYVTVFIVPHMDIELEDNKQFFPNIPRIILNFLNVLPNEDLADTASAYISYNILLCFI